MEKMTDRINHLKIGRGLMNKEMPIKFRKKLNMEKKTDRTTR